MDARPRPSANRRCIVILRGRGEAPALAGKNKIRLPESLHVLGRNPAIYVLIKFFLLIISV